MKRDYGSKARQDALLFSATDDSRGIQLDVEDDGRAAFAYLTDAGSNILSAVWLYNRAGVEPIPTPRSPADLPTPNLPDFVTDEPFEPLSNTDTMEVYFQGNERGNRSAQLYIRAKLHAYLNDRESIGWCVLARRNGPYAKRMVAIQDSEGRWEAELCGE